MSTLSGLFSNNKEIILFVYGLGFFILGFAIMLQTRQSSRLELARNLRWLAAFGFLHAFHEWGDLFIPIQAEHVEDVMVKSLYLIQLALLAASFACLFEFGLAVLRPFRGSTWLRGLPAMVLAAWGFASFFVLLPLANDLTGWTFTSNALARYFIGFPGGTLAAYGLRVHAIRRIQPLNVPVIYRTLRIAGIALGLYAVLAGLIPPPVEFFPGNVINSVSFTQAVGVPPLVFRALLSIIVAVAVIRSLEIFDLETQRKLEEMEQQQIIRAEHDRLARELHDGAIQKVFTAGLLVESAARIAEPASEVGLRLERSVVVLNDAVADLRNNLAELHQWEALPSGKSVAEMLAELAHDPHYNTLANISLDVRLPESKSLSALRASHAMAITNEALANIMRHARASNVKIQAQDMGPRLQIQVSDDGAGFSPDAQPGYGLRNMRDRARLLNGEIAFTAAPGKGTTVTLEVPWID
jgi:signal transduction histidine kinase